MCNYVLLQKGKAPKSEMKLQHTMSAICSYCGSGTDRIPTWTQHISPPPPHTHMNVIYKWRILEI